MKFTLIASLIATAAAALNSTNGTAAPNATKVNGTSLTTLSPLVNVTRGNNTNSSKAVDEIVLPKVSSLNKTNSSNSTNSSAAETIKFTQVHERTRLFDFEDKDAIIVGTGFVGCMLVVAGVAVAVKKGAIGASSAPDASVLAENVVEEIEAAENAAASETTEDEAAPATPAAKDEDIEEVTTDSPCVVSV